MAQNQSSFDRHNFPSKATVVIDGGYWQKVLEHLNLESVDLVALTDVLCTPAYRIRAYYFDGKKQDMQSFHDSLQLLDRFEVYLGELVPRDILCPHCDQLIKTPMQKRVDVALAVELVHLATAGNIELIVLIAGDRDFVPAIETAKHAGVIIRLVHGAPKTVSDTMLKLVDEKIELTIDYLKEKKIIYEMRGEAKIISEIQRSEEEAKEEKIRTESEVKNMLVVVESKLSKMLSQTPEDFIRLSALGTELSKVEPNWKEKTKINHLNTLLKLEESKYIFKEKDNQYYISTTEVVPKDEIFQEIDSAETYVLNVLKEFFKEDQSDSISIQHLGTNLSKNDPEWKKKYKVKQLKKVLKNLENDLILSGKKNNIQIKLKKKK